MDFKTALVEASSSEGISEMENVLMNEKSDVVSIIEAFDFMSGAELSQFFGKISSLASEISTTLYDDEERSFRDDDEVQHAESFQNTENVNKLKKISLITLRYMESSKVSPLGMLDTVQVLHDVLIPLDDALQGECLPDMGSFWPHCRQWDCKT